MHITIEGLRALGLLKGPEIDHRHPHRPLWRIEPPLTVAVNISLNHHNEGDKVTVNYLSEGSDCTGSQAHKIHVVEEQEWFILPYLKPV